MRLRMPVTPYRLRDVEVRNDRSDAQITTAGRSDHVTLERRRDPPGHGIHRIVLGLIYGLLTAKPRQLAEMQAEVVGVQ